MNKAIGRPPKMLNTSIRMKRSTKFLLNQLARWTGWTQGKVVDMAVRKMYQDDEFLKRFDIERTDV